MLSHIGITDDEVVEALRALLVARLPNTDVVRAQVNRVPEPLNQDFVLITPLMRQRFGTNINTTADIILTGAILDDVLTVTAISGGSLLPGSSLFAKTGMAADTSITVFLTGTGGTGTYRITPSQTMTSRTVYAGQHEMLMPTQLTFQCDVHGPHSGENVQRIGTLIRSERACDFFRFQGIPVQPLHADDPIKQMAFVNAEMQYEDQ